jgi:hypothetical protein
MIVSDVDRGGGPVPVHVGLAEEPSFRIEVGLERSVEVEVILREVGEDENGEARPEQAAELGGVRRGLHRAAPVARFEHLAKGALEVDRLGRGAGDRAPLAAQAHLDRPQQPRAAAGGGQDRVEEKGGGRLPIRPGNGGDVELPGRMPEKGVGREGHRSPHVLDDELGNGQVELMLHEERGGATGDGVGREVVPVGPEPGDTGEESARADPPGVVRQVSDEGGSRIDGAHAARGLAERLELDGG